MDNDFSKTLKNYSISYLQELPPADKFSAPENTMFAVPTKEKGKFDIYTWYENKWILTFKIDKKDFDLKDLKDIYNDLNNVVKKLNTISANVENDEMFLKLSKITTKVLQAKFELADNIIEPFEKTCNVDVYLERKLDKALKEYEEENGL